MQRFIIETLARKKRSLLTRYTSTIAIVTLTFFLRLLLGQSLAHYPLLLFFPAIMYCALVYDRGSGYLATAYSAFLSGTFLMPLITSNGLDLNEGLALLLFLAIGMAISMVTEELRQTVVQLLRLEEQKSTLLEELAHRTKNDLTMVASLLRMQAKGAEPHAKQVLESAIARVEVIAKTHERLRATEGGVLIDLGGYLSALCSNVADVLRGVRPIAIQVRAEPIMVSSGTATSIGIVVNELVTNALKYAFAEDQPGRVAVQVERFDGEVMVTVEDDGVGCPADTGSGLGSRLVRVLAGQLGGRIDRIDAEPGCRVTLRLPDERLSGHARQP